MRDMPEASEQENAELERAWMAVSKSMYGNDKLHQQLVRAIDPKDKAGSVAMLVTKLITEVDKKIDIDEGVIGGLIGPTVDAMIELAEKARGLTFSDAEVKQVLGTATEATLMAFGVDEEDYGAFIQERGLNTPEARQEMATVYKGMLGE